MKIPNHEDILKNPRGYSGPALKNHYNELYNHLEATYPNINTVIERLYMYMHNMNDRPKCYCGNELRFMGYKVGYRNYCSDVCANKDPIKQNKANESNMKKYGVKRSTQLDSIKEKVKQTQIERYGGMGLASSKLKKKIIATNLERYGVECASKSDEIKEKVKRTQIERYGGMGLASHILKEKAHQTNLERYGHNVPSKNDEIKNNIIIKYQNQYNVDCGSQVSLFEKFPDLLSISKRNWIMKCPHPECNKCEERIYKTRSMIYRCRLKCGAELCTNLLPIQKSTSSNTTIEMFVRNILDKYNIEYQTNVRNIIKPKELDIYIPSKKLAIECNGIYWHSDNKVSKKYHMDKYLKCAECNIELLTLWEDYIKSKPEYIEWVILSKLGIFVQNVKQHQYRIEKIDDDQYIKFLNDNQIPSIQIGNYKFGIFYNSEIIYVASFSDYNDDTYELKNFYSKNGYNIENALKNIISYFKELYKCHEIISYGSNDILNDKYYIDCDFILEKECISHHYYIDPMTHIRYNSKSSNQKLLKIYDCGLNYWVYKSE